MEETFPTRTDHLQALNDALHSYLVECGYDEGTQLSFQAIYLDFRELPQLSEGQTQAKNRIRQAWDFIRGVVLPYYYQNKATLEVCEDFINYSWNFHELDVSDPCVSLREILSLI